MYYVAFLFRFADSPDLQSLAATIYPLPPAFRADFKDASDMMKAARKDIAFGAPHRCLRSCKDRLVFLLKRQGCVIRTVYPDTAFGAGRSPFHLFTAKSANCQFFCLLFSCCRFFHTGPLQKRIFSAALFNMMDNFNPARFLVVIFNEFAFFIKNCRKRKRLPPVSIYTPGKI